MLRVIATPLWAAKAGNSPDEYEDAFYPVRRGEYRGARLRFAVADGATEGLLSGYWAALLSKLYVRQWKGRERMPEWLARACSDWEGLKAGYLKRREAADRPVQWYEEPGLAAGAFSTLVGITLVEQTDSNLIRWQAAALGDSCLFQVRDRYLMLALPMHHHSQFNSRPFLLASNPGRNAPILKRLETAHGQALPGDRFYLTTDALAAWFLAECEEGGEPWEEFDEGAGQFSGWLGELRAAGRIRNDDTTCLRLQVT